MISQKRAFRLGESAILGGPQGRATVQMELCWDQVGLRWAYFGPISAQAGLCWPTLGLCWPESGLGGLPGAHTHPILASGRPVTPGGGGLQKSPESGCLFICRLETLRSLRSRMFLARCARAIPLELCWDQGGLSRSWFGATLAYVGPCWTKGRLRWLQTLIPTQFWPPGVGGCKNLRVRAFLLYYVDV